MKTLLLQRASLWTFGGLLNGGFSGGQQRGWGPWMVLGLLLSVMIGCSTTPTDPKQIAKRKAERPNAFAALPLDQQQAVDQGQIKAGMSTDAVYLAWGSPAQQLRSGDLSGERLTWLYEGTTTDEYMWWNYREVVRGDGTTYLDRFLDRNINIRTYISAELVFRENTLVEWRMLPRPPGDSYLAPQPPMF